MEQPSKPLLTLDEIAQRKTAVKNEITKQKEIILKKTKAIFTPNPVAGNGVSSFMESFNKGVALYDGVMTGIKMMRRVRAFFSRKDNKRS